MNISFSILDSEVDIIAEQYGFDSTTTSLTKDQFVLEQFKQFGRNCLLGHASRLALAVQETSKAASIEVAKSAISF